MWLRKAELARDLPDLRLFLVGDGLVGCRHRKQAFEQLLPLLLRRNLAELPRHEEILGTAEQPVLVLGDLDDDEGLGFGQLSPCVAADPPSWWFLRR